MATVGEKTSFLHFLRRIGKQGLARMVKLDAQGPCNDARKVIMAMPSNKASGCDRVPLFVIKDCLPHILPTLTGLINSANSVFPYAWKRAVVVPHLKDGDHEVPDNNRPFG